MLKRKLAVSSLVTMIAIGASMNTANAQSTSRPLGPIRVTLLTGISLRKGEHVEVIRSISHGPRNVVLVAATAGPKDLAAALSLLSALRLQHGDSPTTDLRATPASAHAGPRFAGSPYETWLAEQLTRLRSSPVRSVTGIGTAQAVQITLPAPRGRFIG